MDFFADWSKQFHPGSIHTLSYQDWIENHMNIHLLEKEWTCEDYTWKIIDVRLNDPIHDEWYCRKHVQTLYSELVCDVLETDKHGNCRMEKHVCLGNIPRITSSGTFIINGYERVLITQIRMGCNQINVTPAKKGKSCKTRIWMGAERIRDEIEYILSLRSFSEASNHSCETKIALTRNNDIFLVSCSKLTAQIPAALIFYVSGCRKLEDFIRLTNNHIVAEGLFYDSLKFKGYEEECLKMIKLKKSATKNVIDFLVAEQFPHLGFANNLFNYQTFLMHLCVELWESRRAKNTDTRDSLAIKRFDPAGSLMNDLFTQIIKKWITSMATFLKDNHSFPLAAAANDITKKISYCFSTGAWGAQPSAFKKCGVSQVRMYQSELGEVAHLRRFSYPISRDTKNQPMRQLHASHLYYIDPLETPEGQGAGLILHFAVSTMLTPRIPWTIIYKQIQKFLRPISDKYPNDRLCLINGRPVGNINIDINRFFQIFCIYRAQGVFDSGWSHGMISCGIKHGNFFIWCDEGRASRPIKLCDDPGTDWHAALLNGTAQWLDPFEAMYGIKISWKNEICPALILGIAGGLIPLLEYSPCPRGIYASNMMKQAISKLKHQDPTTLNAPKTLLSNILEEPITDNILGHTIFGKPLTYGNMCLVAICPWRGYNQEDAIIVNQSACDRGLFSGSKILSFEFEEEASEKEMKLVSPPTNAVDTYNYCLLDKNGIVKLHSQVLPNDILICATDESNADISVVYPPGELPGYVVHVSCATSSHSDLKIIHIKVCCKLDIQVGDKLTSRYSQKGIIGMKLPCWELPHTKEGLVPDILINPSCLPSRMTASTIKEGQLSMTGVLNGKKFLLEPFEKIDHCDDAETNFTFYDPDDGHEMPNIYMAPMYFIWLAHLADPKCYARGRIGAISKQTHQPTDGRSRGGGLRIGEMERDAILAADMPNVLHDRYFEASDKFWIFVCTKCQNLALNQTQCLCGNQNIYRVPMAYSNYLATLLMRGMGCKIQYYLE